VRITRSKQLFYWTFNDAESTALNESEDCLYAVKSRIGWGVFSTHEGCVLYASLVKSSGFVGVILRNSKSEVILFCLVQDICHT
jgi:hypothetical protein